MSSVGDQRAGLGLNPQETSESWVAHYHGNHGGACRLKAISITPAHHLSWEKDAEEEDSFSL